jgi:hypothetical protein
MDLNQLNIFVNQIKNLIEVTDNFKSQNDNLTNLLEQEKIKYISSLTDQEEKLVESENKITEYLRQNKELEEQIYSLRKENSEKSSKTIWETTQTKLKEKDVQIEELKKSLEFYKRKHTVGKDTNFEVHQEPISKNKEPLVQVKDKEKEKEVDKEKEKEVEKEKEKEKEKKKDVDKEVEKELEKKNKNKVMQVKELVIPVDKVNESVIQVVQITKEECPQPIINPVKNTKITKNTKIQEDIIEEKAINKETPNIKLVSNKKKIIQSKKKEKVEPIISSDIESELLAFLSGSS